MTLWKSPLIGEQSGNMASNQNFFRCIYCDYVWNIATGTQVFPLPSLKLDAGNIYGIFFSLGRKQTSSYYQGRMTHCSYLSAQTDSTPYFLSTSFHVLFTFKWLRDKGVSLKIAMSVFFSCYQRLMSSHSQVLTEILFGSFKTCFRL